MSKAWKMGCFKVMVVGEGLPALSAAGGRHQEVAWEMPGSVQPRGRTCLQGGEGNTHWQNQPCLEGGKLQWAGTIGSWDQGGGRHKAGNGGTERGTNRHRTQQRSIQRTGKGLGSHCLFTCNGTMAIMPIPRRQMSACLDLEGGWVGELAKARGRCGVGRGR